MKLRQSHPLCAEPKITILRDDRFWCAKLDTRDSPSSTVQSTSDGSWGFTLGPVTYQGKRVSAQVLPDLLKDVADGPSAAARKLDGVFVAVVFDRSRQRTLVIPSALSLYPVFMRETDDGLVGLSSSILALTALGRVTLDEFTFQSLFRCGHRLPPSTLFNEIRSVPEGSLVEVGSGRPDVQRYWLPSFSSRYPHKLSATAALVGTKLSDHCSTLIEPGLPVFSDLTGGYDSRVTTACLIHGSIPFSATVTGPPMHPDVLISANICSREHLPLHIFDPTLESDTLSSEIETSLLLSEGCTDVLSFATTLRTKMSLFDTVAARPVATVGGAFGECYRDFYWAQEFFGRGEYRPASIDRLIRYRIDASPWRMDLFARDWRDEWVARLRSYLENIISGYEGERNTSQLDVVYIRKLTGMIGAFSSAVSRFSAAIVPFASLPALDIALSVPPFWRSNSQLLRHISSWLAPQFAEYMTLSGGPCASCSIKNWYRFLPRYRKQAERIIRKFSTVWLGKALFPEYMTQYSNPQPFLAFLAAETRPGGRLHFASMATAEYYRPEALNQLLQDVRLPDGFRHRGAISRIYTCEGMLRMANTTTAQPPHVAGSRL